MYTHTFPASCDSWCVGNHFSVQDDFISLLCLFWLKSSSQCPLYKLAWKKANLSWEPSPPWITQEAETKPCHQCSVVASQVLIIQASGSFKILQSVYFWSPPMAWELCQGWKNFVQDPDPQLYKEAFPFQTLPPPWNRAYKVALNSGSSVASWLFPFSGSKSFLFSLASSSMAFLCLLPFFFFF